MPARKVDPFNWKAPIASFRHPKVADGDLVSALPTDFFMRQWQNLISLVGSVTELFQRNIFTTGGLQGGGNLEQDLTLSIADNGVTFAKMQDISAGTLIGSEAGGDPEEITPARGLEFDSGDLNNIGVLGPATSTDNAIARFDGTTGDLVKDSPSWTVTDPSSVATLSGSSDVGVSVTTTTYANTAGAPQKLFRKARGTAASPSAAQNADFAGLLFFQGYDGAAWRLTAEFRTVIIEPTPSSTAMGGQVQFFATALGTLTRTEVLRYDVANGLSMYGANIVLDSDRLLRKRVYTVGTLPAAGVAGRCAFVSDALAPVFGAAVAGGGAVNVPVYDTGAAWFVG